MGCRFVFKSFSFTPNLTLLCKTTITRPSTIMLETYKTLLSKFQKLFMKFLLQMTTKRNKAQYGKKNSPYVHQWTRLICYSRQNCDNTHYQYTN